VIVVVASGQSEWLINWLPFPLFWLIHFGLPLMGAMLSAVASKWLGDFSKVGRVVALVPARYPVCGIMAFVVCAFLFFFYWLAVTAVVIAIIVAVAGIILFFILKSLGGGSEVRLSDRKILIHDSFPTGKTKLFDSKGNKIGHSVHKTDIFGDEKVVHYDNNGNKTGESVEKESLFGEKRIEHRDADGKLVGSDAVKGKLLGGDYLEHRGEDGKKTGTTEVERGLFGSTTLESRDADGKVIRERSFEAEISPGILEDKLVVKIKDKGQTKGEE
jgi:hypothetical protein